MYSKTGTQSRNRSSRSGLPRQLPPATASRMPIRCPEDRHLPTRALRTSSAGSFLRAQGRNSVAGASRPRSVPLMTQYPTLSRRSSLRESQSPKKERPYSLPAGINRAGGAGWERPPAAGGECDKHSLPGRFFDTKRGVAPSPSPYDPELRGRRGEFPRGTTGIAFMGTGTSSRKRGRRLSCVRKAAQTRSKPQRPRSESSRRSATWTVERSIRAGGRWSRGRSRASMSSASTQPSHLPISSGSGCRLAAPARRGAGDDHDGAESSAANAAARRVREPPTRPIAPPVGPW